MLFDEIKIVLSTKDPKEFRKFGKTIGIFLIIAGLVLTFKSVKYLFVISSLGTGFLLLGLLMPKFLKPIYYLWMSLSAVLGFIMTRIILSLIFFVIFFPVSIILRIIRKDLLDQKIDENAESYWIERKAVVYDPKSSENQY